MFKIPAIMTKAIIVAHPDDEILWFSSQFKEASDVVVCFTDVIDNPAPGYAFVGDKRRRFFKEQPYDYLYSLDLPEPGTFGLVNFDHAVMTATGVKIPDPKAQKKYKQTFEIIEDKIKPILSGKDMVFTHNPWGEYGHPDHILVHRVVTKIAKEKGIPVYWSSYVSNWTIKLAYKILYTSKVHLVTHPTDHQVYNTLLDLYKKHEIWTWNDAYQLPAMEHFLSYAEQDNDGGYAVDDSAFPFLWIDPDKAFFPEKKRGVV